MSAEYKDYPELLLDLIRIVEEVLASHGETVEQSKIVAFETAERVRQNWGGGLIYIPKGKEFMITQRDMQLYEEFNGRNIRLLAAKYGLSDAHVYKIIERVKSADVKRRQVDAFSSSP